MGSWSRIYAIVAGVGLLVYSYLIKRNSALKSENDHLNKEIEGIFVADAAYLSQELANEIYRLGKGFLFAKPRKNMKKLITDFQFHLYNTRMLIEVNFRNLKAFHNLITSLPKSVNGYFANYIFAILAYQFA